jgi:hypothetical protein
MHTCKIQIKTTGEIEGCQQIYADNDAFWVDGIVVPEDFYTTVVADLMQAANTLYFDFQSEQFIDRPLITSEPNKLTLSADSVDSVIFAGLPLPCTVKVNETAYEVNDGEFEFTTDTTGVYTVTVEQFPYITKSWEIEAV